MEATATAVPSTAAGKQKYKWNKQTVEKLICFLFSSSSKAKASNINAAAFFSAILKKENE